MNLAVVVYTNETNLPILKLFLNYFFKNNPNFALPIYVVANKFTKSDLPHQDKVKYLPGNVEFQHNGGHFSETLRNVLSQIKEDYIFYFCEDYVSRDPIDVDALGRLLNMIQDENIDMFTFGSVYAINHGYPVFNIDYKKYKFDNGIFYTMDLNYQHAYTVQPCIWNKASLFKLLQDNPTCSLHDMDNSRLNNKNNYKIICTNFKIYDGCCPPEYFIIGYEEIVRHGVFLLVDNGISSDRTNHAELFVQKVILDNDLHKNPEYDRYFGFDKSLIDKW
jgi:hypothetical protein